METDPVSKTVFSSYVHICPLRFRLVAEDPAFIYDHYNHCAIEQAVTFVFRIVATVAMHAAKGFFFSWKIRELVTRCRTCNERNRDCAGK
jgi:hypothetical protein